VTGEADGVAKTPDWAAAITHVPAETIRRLALECADKPTMLTAAWSLQRADYGEQPYWMLASLAAMLGTIGKPGLGVAYGYGSTNGVGAPRRPLPAVSGPSMRNAGLHIPVARITELLERPGGVLQYNGQDLVLPDIRIVWWAGGNPFHHHQDLPRLQRAWARAETIVVQEPWWTAVARHADIVLPATTTLERNDIASSSRDRFVRAMHQAIPPIADARNDMDMLADVAEELGYRERFTEQRNEEAWLRHLYDRWRRVCATQGFEAPDYDTFWQEGHVEVPPIEPGEEYTQFADFAANPEEHPLDTPSGKVEIFSETIASFGYDDCPGHPGLDRAARVARRGEGGGAPAAPPVLPAGDAAARPARPRPGGGGGQDQGPRAGADAPGGRRRARPQGRRRGARLQRPRRLPRRRAAQRRAAARRGVHGDRRLVRPGTPGDPDALCVHGNPNVLTADVGTSRLGQGPSAQSCLVQIERWDGALPPVTGARAASDRGVASA
jgi:biotin/methionine sulfoxide reductase